LPCFNFNVKLDELARWGGILTENLTQEEIVTQILSSNEMLRKKNENFYITNPKQNLGNLGEFLACMTSLPEDNHGTKYSFIKSEWKI
jgi:hypothetical protein